LRGASSHLTIASEKKTLYKHIHLCLIYQCHDPVVDASSEGFIWYYYVVLHFFHNINKFVQIMPMQLAKFSKDGHQYLSIADSCVINVYQQEFATNTHTSNNMFSTKNQQTHHSFH
jgi:hypothetical protein